MQIDIVRIVFSLTMSGVITLTASLIVLLFIGKGKEAVERLCIVGGVVLACALGASLIFFYTDEQPAEIRAVDYSSKTYEFSGEYKESLNKNIVQFSYDDETGRNHVNVSADRVYIKHVATEKSSVEMVTKTFSTRKKWWVFYIDEKNPEVEWHLYLAKKD